MFTRTVAVTSYIKGVACVLHATWLLWSGGGEIIFSAYLCAQVWDEDLPRRVRRALHTDYLLELHTPLGLPSRALHTDYLLELYVQTTF